MYNECAHERVSEQFLNGTVVTSEIKLKQNSFVSVLFQTWLHVK